MDYTKKLVIELDIAAVDEDAANEARGAFGAGLVFGDLADKVVDQVEGVVDVGFGVYIDEST